MEPFAVGFVVSIAAAAVTGILVGAIGGAVVWRMRMNLVVGSLLTACAYLLILLADGQRLLGLRGHLYWGVPLLILGFLLSSVAARWLRTRIKLRPTWIALQALGLALTLGFLNLLLFRWSFRAPPLVALAADACLFVLLIRSQRRVPNDA
jgi:hypothetical protein